MSDRSTNFFLDDDPDYANTAIEKLEAEELISLFEEYHINVAILDRQLNASDDHNVDGERVGEEIQRTHPEVILIGNSSDGIKCATLNNFGKEITPLVEMVTNA